MSSFVYHRAETLIEVDNVCVSYGNKPILKNLSVSIENVVRPGVQQGQIVSLLGPSGIGKTTLIRVMSGLVKPDSGTVRIGPLGLHVTPGDVGVVAQHYPLLPHKTVVENLIFAGRQAGMDAKTAKEKANEMLVEFHLEDHHPKYPIQLSGGQRQRVAIAQQMMCAKNYLILDEPFSGLDPVSLAKVRQLLQEVSMHHEENTFIIITHDVKSAVAISDTIWLMGRDRDEEGKIIPGARIVGELDLLKKDIAWHPEAHERPRAVQLIQEIEHRFLTL